MMEQYLARCVTLGVRLSSGVCSDRGLMDKNLVNGPTAFPDAHINVDAWHFQWLFGKSLSARSLMNKSAHREFRQVPYAELEVFEDALSWTSGGEGVDVKYGCRAGQGVLPLRDDEPALALAGSATAAGSALLAVLGSGNTARWRKAADRHKWRKAAEERFVSCMTRTSRAVDV